MKTKRIALVMAGGVSLGSYEAGVLSELLYALETLNQSAGPDDHRFELDVMAGGSAGGMTAAIVGRMIYEMPARKNALHSAWVEDIDIAPLLNDGDIPSNALLSKRVIGEISQRYLVEPAPGPGAPASFAPETLRFSLSMSNMNGLTYRIPYANSAGGAESFMSTFFADMARFTVEKSNPAATPWPLVKAACIACGNFPIAFAPQRVPRTAGDYPGAQEAENPQNPLFSSGMTFVDGGLFNNEPLGEAIRRAAEADGAPGNQAGGGEVERLYVLIDPFINTSKHRADITPEDRLFDIVLRLVTMIRGESTARDWLRAERINDQLRWRQDLVGELRELVQAIPEDKAPAIAEKAGSMSRDIARQQRRAEPEGAATDMEEHVRRSLPRDEKFRREQAALADEQRRDVFSRLIFALDQVADLESKSIIELKAIDADQSELAGEKLQGFAGFFEREWREHDFRVGRRKAHELLPDILGREYPREQENGEPISHYVMPPEWADLKNATIADTNPEHRRAVRDVMLDRVVSLLRDFGFKSFYRWVARLILRRLLNRFLQL